MSGGLSSNELLINLSYILDVMVLNDIIEQAAGRHSRASDHGGELLRNSTRCFFIMAFIMILDNNKKVNFSNFLTPTKILFLLDDDNDENAKEVYML